MNVAAGRLCVVVLCCLMWAGAALEAQRPKSKGRVQTGFATYYSRSFDGQQTASGSTFDGDRLVAAHRTLPFGTVVKVTNLENGRTVRVRIVDRGPYGENHREGTIIDLSPAAAKRLRMIEDGQVRARVEVIRRGPGRPTDARR